MMCSYHARDICIPRGKQQRCCRPSWRMHTAAVTLCPLQALLNILHSREQALPFQQATGSHGFTLPPCPYWLSEPLVPFASKHTCNHPVSLITQEVWHRLPPFFTWVSVSEICTLSFCPFIIPWYTEKPSMLIQKHRSNSITPSTLTKPSSGSLDL